MILTLGDKDIIIFTDGSSRGNPGPGGYGAVAIYNDEHGGVRVDEIGGREDVTTNNRMELRAVIEAIKNFENYYQNLSEHRFVIFTDSSYVLNGATKWLHNWQKNSWISSTKEEVKNQDLWQIFSDFNKQKLNFKWNLLEGHAGVAGNERCDVIATSFADNNPTDLYTGTLSQYEVQDILNIKTDETSLKRKEAKKKSKSGKSGVAYSYVSSVDGKVMTHKTWAECEARVKGISKTRFKKVFSKDEEVEVIKEFSK